MLPASELRSGMAVRIEGTLHKVMSAEHHSGSGKMGGVTHARLQNLDTGRVREWRFRGDEPLEGIEPERQAMPSVYTAIVPPFIGTGETIRVQVETGTYVGRERGPEG